MVTYHLIKAIRPLIPAHFLFKTELPFFQHTGQMWTQEELGMSGTDLLRTLLFLKE